MSNLNKRISQLEQGQGDDTRQALIEQIIDIWGFIGDEPTQAEAEEIADHYLEQGITILTWELIFRRDTEYNGWE